MNRFEIGEEVITLTNPANSFCQHRVKGKKYTVTDAIYCSTDGHQSINIDNTPSARNRDTFRCTCRQTHTISINKGFTDSKYFIRPEDLEAEMEMAAEEGDFEKATELRNIKDGTTGD